MKQKSSLECIGWSVCTSSTTFVATVGERPGTDNEAALRGGAGALIILLPSIGVLRSRQRPLFPRHWMRRRQCCPSLEQSGPCQDVGITLALCIRSRSATHSGTMLISLWRRRRTRLRHYALFCNRTRICSLERGPRMRMR